MKKMQRKRPGTSTRPGQGPRGTKSFFRRKKQCKFCVDHIEDIDYKHIDRLEKFMTERGKILPSRISGMCARHQRFLARAIKRARSIALLPYVANYR